MARVGTTPDVVGPLGIADSKGSHGVRLHLGDKTLVQLFFVGNVDNLVDRMCSIEVTCGFVYLLLVDDVDNSPLFPKASGPGCG